MKKIVQKSLNYLKALTAETVSNANSGHTGTALGGSSILFALFKDHYKFDVSDTDFLNRDRFVLSAGHASALYYSLLAMFGFDVSLQDLKNFRKIGSITSGHPEFGLINAVETSTGPLGEGVANAVGMAIAESIMEEKFNNIGFPIINNYTYCFAGDGDLMEGVAQEACSVAGAYKLNRFILLYDCNEVTIDGSLNLSNRENVRKKFKAMGFRVIEVKKGNSFSACTRAIAKAKKSDLPTIIIFHTTIGIGTEKEGTSAVHAYPLKKEELVAFKEKLGVKESFFIPSDVREFCMESTINGKLLHEKWNQDLAVYATTHPDLYKKLLSFFDSKKIDYEKLAQTYNNSDYDSIRDLNHSLLNDFADKFCQIFGGTADVAPSTKAYIDEGGDFVAGNKRGRNFHFGVREHAMAAICNGISLYEDFLPFDSTFLAFSNYMIPALRMRAMMKLPVLDIFTHDSILIGEDGPSHQPIEQIAMLRSILGLNVFRPCDVNELIACYKMYFTERKPTSLILPKQKVISSGLSSIKNASLGGYILKPAKKSADIVLMASGSEIPLALSVAKELEKSFDVSVVSMPCFEIFEQQSDSYKSKILQPNAKLRVAIEASNDSVWYKFMSSNDIFIKVENYMPGGEGEQVYQKAGFSVKQILKQINKKLKI